MKFSTILFWLSSATLLSAGESIQPLLQEYCITCHGADKQKGDVRLDQLDSLDAELWTTVYEQLASEEMPPDDEAQPSEDERDKMMNAALDVARQSAVANTTGFRRLNKREYGNTVRDLLGLKNGTFDPGEYIYDDEVEGFDTEAEALVISNELLLEYLGAAEKSLRHALFSAEREEPKSEVVVANLKRMKGTSGRYINTHNDYAIGRGGGKEKLYDGESTRTKRLPGRYRITVTASGVDRDTYPIPFTPEEGPLIMGFGVMADAETSLAAKGELLRTFELKDNVEQTFEFDTWIDKDHFPYFSFVNGSSKPITQIRSNIRRRILPPSAMKEPYKGPGIRISQFKIEGPFHDEWPPQTFQVTYDSEQIPDLSNRKEREQLVHRFAARAFRHPVTEKDVAPYIGYLNQQRKKGLSWHESVIKTFAAIMASFDFLYLVEEPGELDSHELANRLSYFLWSTMPDAELMEAANSERLKDPAVFQTQLERLLNDPRSQEFTNSFTDQWLSLDKLGTMPPDARNGYREYYRDNLESAMLEETRRYFRYVLQENLAVRDFIDSDYSFLNKGLASLYGVPFEGEPDEFARVSLPPDAKRGGLLGHGSILTLTSNGVETSPIVRGHWVLEELLGTPPPPAPKEVPALTPDLTGATTVRQQMEKHRTDPACIECHRQMDPLGLALEAFDPIGRLRTEYWKDQPVTTYGAYKGVEFDDVMELKKIMLTDVRPFARNLTIRIAEYAKGRTLAPADFSIVEEIVDQAAEDDYRLRDILMDVATSELLLNR